jgi:hypothetical protein
MPRLLKRFLLRVRATLSAQQDHDTRAVLDLHLRLLEEEYLAKGVAPSDARRLAGRVTLAVRLANPSLAQAASVRQQAQTILGDVRAGRTTTISQELERSIARERLTSGIALFLAVLVVVIGCIGIYALMTYDVTRRQREFGVRLALGATAGRLVATVLHDGAAILGPALAIGIPAGLAAGGLLASQLYGVDARDPWTLSSVAVLLSVVAMAAAFRPARLARASIRWRSCATSDLRLPPLVVRECHVTVPRQYDRPLGETSRRQPGDTGEAEGQRIEPLEE